VSSPEWKIEESGAVVELEVDVGPETELQEIESTQEISQLPTPVGED
jgi:hypothetical protein